jgi:predicted GIY-YIG superfamily endonuclease
MAVYILHIEPSYKHAAHYTGYADDVAPRLYAHLHRQGARLTQVAIDAGCTLLLVRVWQGGDRAFERRLKRNSHIPTLCPICNGAPVQLPLLTWMPAYVPADEEIEAILATMPIDNCQLALNLFDIDAETQDLIEAREDVEFWRGGNW